MTLSSKFLALSKEIGSDPLLVQGPGGNASCKDGSIMHVKASGTELASALEKNIFATVDVAKAVAEIDGASDGTCRSAMTDPTSSVRPSIETTFHALLPQIYVFHYHSVSTICHSISRRGKEELSRKLQGIRWVSVPYCKPGIPLSKAIRSALRGSVIEAVILENHGIIVASDSLDRIGELVDNIEQRLHLPFEPREISRTDSPRIEGWTAVPELRDLLFDKIMNRRATAGSYYPDHVVFLGPAIGVSSADKISSPEPSPHPFPAILVENTGVYIKESATGAQHAMLRCIFDVLSRIPPHWTLSPIGTDAEAELLNWDAEIYRQSLAKD